MGLRGIGLEAERYARKYHCSSFTLVPSCFARQSYSQQSEHRVTKLSRDILAAARPYIRQVQPILNRRLINQIHIDHIACLFHLVNECDSVIAIASLENAIQIHGITGWGVEFAKQVHKPLYVYNLDKDEWMQWKGSRFELCKIPYLCARTGFIGIKNVNDFPESLRALKRVFKTSLK